jgi:hypothetical protein
MGVNYALQSVGMLFIETAGAYFLARTCIRSQEDFTALCRLLFWIVALLLPLAAYESVTHQAIILKLFGSLYPSHEPVDAQIRWGLRRAQGPFEHPILFGVFCGAVLAPTFLVLGYRRSFLARWGRAGIVGAATFCSLSAGPLSALAVQIGLLGWNWLFRRFAGRWKLFWILFGWMYLTVSMLSHQSPAEHMINLVAFDKGSAYQRILIWRYGSASIAAHPLFGVGYGDWSRMQGQTSSVDMFWIISSLRHGIMAGVLLGVAYLGSCLMVGLKRGLSDEQVQSRIAYLIAMAGFFVAGWTVDYWAEIYTTFFFLLGSGLWLLDAREQNDAAPPEGEGARRRRPARAAARQRATEPAGPA